MKIGDVVRLKTGGPNMAIHKVEKDVVVCQWFEGFVLRDNEFIQDSLELVQNNGITHVFQVMDGSASMSPIWDEINGMMHKAYKAHADAMRDGANVRLTSFVFDSESYPPEMRNIDPTKADCIPLTLKNGMTALNDAIGTAIKLAKEDFKDGLDEAVLVQIYTDGGENYSSEWTHEAINAEITRLQATNKWTFQFIGANQIAERTAHDYGIRGGNAIRFSATKGGVQSMTKGIIASNTSYYAARAGGACSVDNSFGSDAEGKTFEDQEEESSTPAEQ